MRYHHLPVLVACAVALSCSSPEDRLASYDLTWDNLTADPVYKSGVKHSHSRQTVGYYDGAIMGNGLLGTNFYKLENNAYRLNIGRSDVHEMKDGELNDERNLVYRRGRLPIGYFTLRTVGNVKDEQMRLHLYDAVTTGRLTTDGGTIDFRTYVCATRNAVVFETSSTGFEKEYGWDFVPQKAISPVYNYCAGNYRIINHVPPTDYMRANGSANPAPWRESVRGVNLLVQPLAADTTFTKIAKYYVVGWKETAHGGHRRVIATVSQDNDLVKARDEAVSEVLGAFRKAGLERKHKEWWHKFYAQTAEMTFPDEQIQGFYWMQCYKFASTARPDKPIVDLQGVWPVYDTPWPALWMNLNIQLTYNWQSRLGMGEFVQPLLDALWDNRANLVRNVTDNPGQEDWTECMAIPRMCSYDMRSRLDPALACRNCYEAGNLILTLFYCHQLCDAYGDDTQMREKVFPLLKAAVNLFFRIRTVDADGSYGLPPTASPEYPVNGSIGSNANYDLANLRWGVQTLIDLDCRYGLNDPLLPAWKDFLENMVPFRYSEETGFKVSDEYEFLQTTHRHYSHLFMIFPYHMLDWDNPVERARMNLSLERWNGNEGYSRSGKASMLCARGDKGDGDHALEQIKELLNKRIRHNTLYNESGPVIETPFSAVCSLEDMYLQDWGGVIRIFRGCPESWKDCSFRNMRASGAFLVSAERKDGKTVSVQVKSEKGGLCRVETENGLFEFQTAPGEVVSIKPFDNAIWDASEWISVADAPIVSGVIDKGNQRSADGASCFLREFELNERIVSAKWIVTSLGIFQIKVNGVPVGEEFLRPGFTDPEKTKLSFTYDVTNLVKKGVNRLDAQVTPGWWADRVVTPNRHDGMVGNKCAFRGVLELKYKDGTRKLIGTDTLSWKAGITGPVKHAGIYDGEEYDARCSVDLDALGVPEVNKEFTGIIFPSDGAEVYLRKDLTLEPVKAYSWKSVEGDGDEEYGKVVIDKTFKAGETMILGKGETIVVDFGQNAAAVPSFVFRADAGTTLTCLPAEILNDGNGAKNRGMDGPEGSIHRTNLRSYDEHFVCKYTFGAASGWVHYKPECTFFGYRYLSLTADGKVEIRSIESIPVSSITKGMETGMLTTGNEEVNKLISNTIWGMRSNYLSVPTDCPQRDERVGWTADTQVFAETGSFFAATDSFLRKWMGDMRDIQTSSGAFRSVAPIARGGRSRMRIGWADAGIIVPWIVWKQFADTSIIAQNWDAMSRFADHVDETKYDNTLLNGESGNYQFADWLSYEPLSNEDWFVPNVSPKKPRPETVEYWNYLGACYWIMDAGMMRDMAAATGRDTAKWEEMLSRAKSYAKENFLTPDGLFKNEILNSMQTPALFALKTGIVDGLAKEAVIQRLRENFAAHGNCLQTGFLGTSILMSVLTENGMADIAYDLLFQHRNPSWLYSVDNGATTIWERWNSYTLESGMGPKGMNSFNHYAYGCVCEWIWETVAGIAADPVAPGFKHIIMKPVPDRRLGYIKAEYRSAAGLIMSEWHYKGNTWVWTFTIPDGATADVTIPGETESRFYRSGTYTVKK